jgi:hypothetical protein
MKYKSLAVIASVLAMVATTSAQNISSHFENLDFEAGVVNVGGGFNGFDNPAHDIPGWRDHAGIFDAGVEGPGAWWGTYAGGHSAFINGGGSAYNLSDYTIQPGDLFAIEFVAKSWPWTDPEGIGEWTVGLFYDDPANVFGSYTTPPLGDNSTWIPYATLTPIVATALSEGGKLGILFSNTGGDIAQFDGIVISVVPEPTTISLAALAGFGLLLNRRRGVK